MIERAFGEVTPTIDAVHDLQVCVVGLSAHALQKAHEAIGLLEMAEDVQRIQDEGRITQPRESIVPVAHAADLFRQRCRWRRDNRARLAEST